MKNINKWIALVMVAVLSLSITVFVSAQEKNAIIVLKVGSPQVIFNTDYTVLDTGDPTVSPVIIDNITYVPVTFLNEKLNMTIDVNSSGSMTIENTVYAPVRNMATSKGFDVYFKDGIIIISNDKKAVKPTDAVIQDYIQKLSGLPVVGTAAKLEALIGDYLNQSNYKLYGSTQDEAVTGGIIANDQATAIYESSVPQASQSSSQKETGAGEMADTSYSTTNVQVQGVDEGDIIKTDGKYIYFSPGNGDYVSVIKATPANSMEEVAKVDLANHVISDLYLNNNQLIVVASASKNQLSEGPAPTTVPKKIMDDRMSSYAYYYQPVTKVFVYDINNVKAIKQVKAVEADGSMVSSRKVGNYFYFITQSNITKDGDKYIMPQFSDSALKNTTEVDLKTLCYFPESIDYSVSTISGIKLDDLSAPMSNESFLGNSGTIYMSADNLYITTYSYNYNNNRPYAATTSTNIYKFAANEGAVKFSARGRVEGNILNQFSMDEYNTYFRIATTTWTNSGKKANNMFVLDKELKKAGSLTDIAPGENIYSVRFLGDKAHMVTFETTDPLFVIDLAAPTAPKILGELKIPGYSTYLHPYDENHLIGFGLDTVEKEGIVMTQGMKVSMFDITDLNNPKEMFTTTIGDSGTYSELLYNHKALLFNKEKNLLAFPVEVRILPANKKDERWAYGEMTFQGAYVYEINLNKGFENKAKISNTENAEEYNQYVQRILYIGDTLYTVSNKSVKATSMNGYNTVGAVQLNN